jgi:hypothetical protein
MIQHCPQRDPSLTVIVVWPPFHRPRRGSRDGHGTRRTDPQVRIPPDLAGPVDLALARSVDQIPGPHALPSGCRYEVKWDGYLH